MSRRRRFTPEFKAEERDERGLRAAIEAIVSEFPTYGSCRVRV